MTAASRPSDRIPALDGLRAIAILLVLIHNAGSVIGDSSGIALKLWGILANAGWAGVQLFFALSGFLITRILLESKGAPGWMRAFYARRVLRIVPLYLLVLVLVLLVAPHISDLAPLSVHTRSTVWYWTYMSNWAAPFGGMVVGLTHLWSLAVEEQFYLIWPLVVAASGRRALAAICVALVVSALIVRLSLHLTFSPELASEAAYTWTAARWDAIALGGLVALAAHNVRASAFLRAHLVGIGAGAVTAVAAVMVVGRGLSPKGLLGEFAGQPFTAVLSAAAVAACVLGPGVDGSSALRARVSSWLSARWLSTIGKYSYAVYVFHLPVHLVLRPHFEANLATGSNLGRFFVHVGYTAVVFTISMLLAQVSWRILEQPMLSLKRYVPMPVGSSR